MVKYLLSQCVVPVASHRMFGVAVARQHRGPSKMLIVPTNRNPRVCLLGIGIVKYLLQTMGGGGAKLKKEKVEKRKWIRYQMDCSS